MNADTSVLGGEVRNQKGMQRSAVRWFVVVVLVLGGSLIAQTPGAIVGLVLSGVFYALTLSAGDDRSVLRNWADRRRHRRAVKSGFDTFRPAVDRPVNCDPKSKDWNSYRDFVDGMDEWELLDPDPEAVAVRYHFTPAGERYLAATFRVDGPLVGLAGDDELRRAQRLFGVLLDGWGSRQKLVSGLQIITRMLPPTTVAHGAWWRRQMDPSTDAKQLADYVKLLGTLVGGGYVQRHYVTLRWDRTDRFNLAAKQHGKGAEGWLTLVLSEVDTARRKLIGAGYQRVTALTGPMHAALLLHLQNPDRHPDEISDVSAAAVSRPSVTLFDRVITDGKWQHRTAEIPPSAIETAERDGLWTLPMLVGMEAKLLRTLSLNVRLIPAADAKRSAKRAATSDRANQISDVEKGRENNDDTEVALSAAQRRIQDLRPGSGHHGAEWSGHITVTVPVDGGNMATASAVIEDAADACGLTRLDWCDSYHSIAQCYTWPEARGFPVERIGRGSRVLETMSLRSAK